MYNTVVIPSAGVGSRIGSYTKYVNKALVTLGDKPAICHVIDQFPNATKFVIPVGYKAETLKQVLRAFYHGPSNFVFEFVDVDIYEGEGSGLGYSLLCAKEHLQEPFIFTPNDTILPDVAETLQDIESQFIVYATGKGDVSQYRTLTFDGDNIVSINPKGVISTNPYVGVCGIQDYESFWEGMEDTLATKAGEVVGIKSAGLSNFKGIETRKWIDIGNPKSLDKAKKLFKSEHNILEKEDEAIWFNDNQVIKFSVNEDFIKGRVERSKEDRTNLIPQVVCYGKNVYSYDKIDGTIMSKVLSDEKNLSYLPHLLDKIQHNMWGCTPPVHIDEWRDACRKFYVDKTKARYQHYLKRFEAVDIPEYVNGIYCPKISDMLNIVNWDDIILWSRPSYFHGDFHNENIILSEGNQPMLIDWRETFGYNNRNIGDVYYDLAKFLHGLLVPHSSIHAGQFSIERDNNQINISIQRPKSFNDAVDIFNEWLTENVYNVEHVRLMTALIFTNIMGLHEAPYSLFLFYLAKKMLAQELLK